MENPLSKRKNQDLRRYLSFSFFFPFILFFSSGIIFATILIKEYYTDLDSHIYILERHLEMETFPVPPLYYYSIYTLERILSAGYIFNTVLILSLFVVWKFLLAQKYLMESIPKSHMVLVSLLLLGLMFYFPVYVPGIDGSKLYLGKFTPTIWHNSTTIFAFAMQDKLQGQSLLISLAFSSAAIWLSSRAKFLLLCEFFYLLKKPD